MKNIVLEFNHQLHTTLAVDQINQQLNETWQGRIVNFSENKRALHIHQRNIGDLAIGEETIHHFFNTQDEFLRNSLNDLEQRGCQNVICVGFGGSSLGLKLLDDVLGYHQSSEKKLYFIDHLDTHLIDQILDGCDFENTVVVYISKSGVTKEVVWLRDYIRQSSFCNEKVITANQSLLSDWGCRAEDIIYLHPEVNGRFSIWSPILFPVAFKYGESIIETLRSGGRHVDQIMMTTPLMETIPGQLAALSIQEQANQNSNIHCFLNYDQRLNVFGHYLQQLEMESLGKPYDRHGRRLSQFPGQFILTEFGSQAQHSIMQYIHQHHQPISMTFLMTQSQQPGFQELERHVKAQINTLEQGYPVEAIQRHQPHLSDKACLYRAIPGEKPTRVIKLLNDDIETLGALIALYEYKVMIEAFHWGINPFDQFAVERPKQLLERLV
ncbi:MAG: hypothetical protein CMF42_06020 [Legionellales bacterium]|nr:hypothetical protein [Legionellales bacterium]OUX66967.1 MAG: hypothetical protein CBD38_04365 [bacterium TMED178]|tara:strand:+ start:7386 stop:8702 length:1317 start_codon:yes stop_codon:yes gene_type:complete